LIRNTTTGAWSKYRRARLALREATNKVRELHPQLSIRLYLSFNVDTVSRSPNQKIDLLNRSRVSDKLIYLLL
jgi:hypothetical protein